jgi:hypothetical protein
MSRPPELSVVLVTDRYETIRTVVERFHAQTARERIELVIVIPRRERVQLDAPELQGFAAVLRVETDSVVPIGAARAAGVRKASAQVVFLGETHAFPVPTCAEVLIEAHRGPWVAVVPLIKNANPSGALSWAGLMLDYGRWFAGPRREIDLPPAYNLAYKRAVLLERAERLPELLEPGSALAAELRAGGHCFLLEPGAQIEHLNVAVGRHWLRERFLVGRLVASRRAAQWSRGRRLVYCAGAPVLPLVLLVRLLRHGGRPRPKPPRLFYPALGLGASAWALGELAGYALGAGERMQQDIAEYELHKSAYVSGSSR